MIYPCVRGRLLLAASPFLLVNGRRVAARSAHAWIRHWNK